MATFQDFEGRELNTSRVEVYEAVGMEFEETLYVKLTDEGVIIDLYDADGNLIATSAEFYDQIRERLIGD